MISIIVPASNEEQYIIKTLQSLKRQDYQLDYEIIVVVNNSKDKTEKYSKRFADKVFNIGNVGKCGASKARNFGAEQAEGDIILFIDADTIAPRTWISEYAKFFESTPYKAISGILYPIENEKTLIDDLSMRIFNWIILNLIKNKYILGGNCGFRKTFFEKVGGFPESPFLEDIELALIIKNKGLDNYLLNTKNIFVYTSLRKREYLTNKIYWGIKYIKYYNKIKKEVLVNKSSPPTLRSLTLTSGLSPTPNKRVSGSGFQPSPKPSARTSDARQTS